MNAFLRICDFIFVLRPLILIPAWSFYLIGAGPAKLTGSQPILGRLSHWTDTGLPSGWTFICLTAVLITAYLLNQIFDRDTDAHNDKCPYLTRGIFSVRTLLLMALLCYLVASYSFRQVETVQRIPLIAALLLSLLYSLPPVRLCSRPILDMLANAIGYGGIAYILGTNLGLPFHHGGYLAALPFVLLVAATFLHTTILDAQGDRLAGKFTTTVLIGTKASRVLAVVLHAAAVLASFRFGTPIALILTLITLPLTVVAAFGGIKRSSLQAQGTTALITLAAAAMWPAYLLILIPLILLSRFYHRRRFGFNYPGLRKIS